MPVVAESVVEVSDMVDANDNKNLVDMAAINAAFRELAEAQGWQAYHNPKIAVNQAGWRQDGSR
jgi:hypothetical protein